MSFVFGRDGALHHLGGQAEVLAFVGLDEDRLAAGVLHHVFERDPVRHRDDDLIAVIDQHLDGVKQRVLAADRGNRFFALVGAAEIRGMALG